MAKKKAAATEKITVEQIRTLILDYVNQEYDGVGQLEMEFVDRIEFDVKSDEEPYVKLWGPKPKDGTSRPRVSFGMKSYYSGDGY